MNQKPCTFYIVRHGETEWNKLGILQGHADSPLTEAGIRQAEERSKTFKDTDFADAFSSDSFRAKRTAEIIAADKALSIQTTQLLREQSYGSYDGQLIAKYKEELKELLEYRESLSENERFIHKLSSDIESNQETVERMLTFIRETAMAYPGKNVLVITHGGIMRYLLVKLGYGTFQTLIPGTVKNLAYVILESDGIEFEIKKTEGVNPKQN